jgi:hypothetical protein
MFSRLLSEVERLREVYGLDAGGALRYIHEHLDEYSSELVMEYQLFISQGIEMLSPVE